MEFDLNVLFLAKVLERRLECSLLPPSLALEGKDPRFLFIAGRYEEALEEIAEIGETELSDREVWIRIATLALMGRREEALRQLTQPIDTELTIVLDRSIGEALIYCMMDDSEKAMEVAFDAGTGENGLGYLLLLILKNLSH